MLHDLRSIARACGHAQPNGNGYLCSCPVPSHGKGRGDRNPSLSIAVGDNGSLLARCFTGCDARDVLLELRKRGLLEDRQDDRPRPRPALTIAHRATDDQGNGTRAALRIWNNSTDPRGTLGETYLASRKLHLGEDVAGAVLRWNGRINALVCLFRDIETDQPKAITRIFLDGDGRKIERKFLGPVGGAAIKLDPDENVVGGIHIGEGIETCLAARELGYRPTWALGSCVAVGAFPILAGVELMTLLREHDDANKRNAEECGVRWRSAGRCVFNVWPKRGKDLNDTLMTRGAA